MLIDEMSAAECGSALEQMRFGRLACSRDNQPYVVPIYFTFDGRYLYAFTTLGRKVEWMRANPLVCVEVDDVQSQFQWMSVVVFGLYEELPDAPRWEQERRHAHALLESRAMWWEPAYVASAHRGQPHSLTPIFYRIRINSMTGHRAMPDPNEGIVSTGTARAKHKDSWWRSIFADTKTKKSL